MIPDRIAARIEVGDCWQWIGHVRRDGYGDVWFGGRTRMVHRLVYQLLVRPLSVIEQLDHLCRNRACVNPDHLDVVSARTNILRGFGAPALAARRTSCPIGHPLTPVPDGSRRVCRECGRLACRNWRLKTGRASAVRALSRGVAA
jgi:hypothetical protein